MFENSSREVNVLPMDEHNQKLVNYVHPADWVNPQPQDCYDLVVIGAGTAGLVVAAGAAGLDIGLKVALVEKHLMGGDCLNFGCIPSKCLIRSSRIIGEIEKAKKLGIDIGDTRVDFARVMTRMRQIRADISHHDSVQRFQKLGIDVFLGSARFLGQNAVEVTGKTLDYKKAVIATGARAFHPHIPGLKEAGFYTNETIFSLTELGSSVCVMQWTGVIRDGTLI
jgi:pyruvate/2-oxoglutarate dehydrogenase complex dihydrolipoamide dehydrogenase (E3) component